jgi:hypothetical protein
VRKFGIFAGKHAGSLTAGEEKYFLDRMCPALGRFIGENIHLFKHEIDGIITSDPLLARQVLEER